MTREERLEKLRRNSTARPTRGQPKPEPSSFEEICATALTSKPVDLAEVLECRGKEYL